MNQHSFFNFFKAGCILTMFVILFSCSKKRAGKPKVLVFSKTADWVHTSIPAGLAALQKLGAENNFETDTTTNAARFTEDSLKPYAAVIFLNTTGDVLNYRQEAAFERYIQSGGGFVGIHSATDTEYDWGWYGRLVGGYFNGHPEQQNAVVRVVDNSHASTKHLPKEWKRFDEWYNFKKLNKDVKVLLTLDESTYKGGTNGTNHPVAWYHDFEGGRAFYTALGHTDESYSEPNFLKHVLGGIQYAIGDNKELDFGKAKTQMPPDEDRFVKTTLTKGTLFEPTEMAILPNLDVLIAQRRGEIMRYSNEGKNIKQVGLLNVYHKTTVPNVNAEEGIMGLALDPDFKNNNYIYVYYSPFDTSVNRLSRFVFKNDTLDMKSEKVVLQLYSQRNICCHTGGSIAFGKDNLLYLSTGDNSTPFDAPNQKVANHGFAPLDNRKGFEQYDARRSAGNTADLRGKIIRIRIKADGTYEIPEGNLFPNNPKARPEIYVMGNRNPYRISVDKRTGFLYWGEVGPDAANDSLQTRGPRGYDEVNQARKAGFFGWPLFVGNNYAYNQYDYSTGTSGAFFDPAKPVNNSPNNTGLQDLPPAQPAFIWYPYAASKEFPQVGQGGRNAMAGPVYYTEDFPKETRLPDYYNNKLFIYDWIRGWVKAVTMLPNGDFDEMEPFMESTRFSAPIDMETGPDGKLYVLEYGSGWFSKNEDAGLSRIDYLAGNRPPKIAQLKVEQTSGGVPYTLKATVDAKDPEGDALTYRWTIGKEVKETKEPQISYTINNIGDYAVSVEVIDDEKAASKSDVVEVYAGNTQPQLDITVQGNRSFYFAGHPVVYKVAVADKGDSVNWNNLFLSVDYVQGYDRAGQSMGHQQVSATILGKNMVQSMDCKACHKEAEKSVGPAYAQVATRYAGKPDAAAYLVQKIIKGGSGAWGEVAMPAHPTLKESDAQQIVAYVMSLNTAKGTQKSLPPTGQIVPAPKKPNDALALQASYTDNGGNGVKPLSSTAALFLRPASMDARMLNNINGFTTKDSANARFLAYPQNTGWIKLNSIDLNGLQGIEIINCCSDGNNAGLMEIRLDSPEGTLAGSATVQWDKQKGTFIIPVQKTDGQLHDVFLVYRIQGKTTSIASPLIKGIRFVPQAAIF